MKPQIQVGLKEEQVSLFNQFDYLQQMNNKPQNKLEKPFQSYKTSETSDKTTSHILKYNDTFVPTQENKKIRFIDQNNQPGQSVLDFQKFILEKLTQYRKNIKNLDIKYKICHYDSKRQILENQTMQEQDSSKFPKLLLLSFNNFQERFKEEKYQNYDEILQYDKLIMKVSFDKIEIYDKNGKLNESKKSFPFSITHTSKEIKYNQTIGQKDVTLLEATGMFVTSNIVDSYANYLRFMDEDEYFSLNAEKRKKYKRTYIFCSDYITNCSIKDQNNEIKWLTLFYEQLSNFESIQYQFWHIYQNIIFVVNQNFHWFCIRLDLEQDVMEIYDSLPKSPIAYERLQVLFQTIFSEIMKKKPQFKIKIINEFPKQQDYYSCGYFSCIALNYLTQKQFDMGDQIEHRERQKFISKAEIKQILRDLLIEGEDK